MPLKLFVERTSGYSQPLGRSFHTALLLLKYSFDVLAFEFNQSEIGTRIVGLRSSSVMVPMVLTRPALALCVLSIGSSFHSPDLR